MNAIYKPDICEKNETCRFYPNCISEEGEQLWCDHYRKLNLPREEKRGLSKRVKKD